MTCSAASFRAHLAASGVDLWRAVEAAEPSTLAVAELDAHGQATFSFRAQATADWQWTSAELAAVDLTDTTCVHTGSLALVKEPGAGVVEDFLAAAAPGPPSASTPTSAPSWYVPRSTVPGWRTGAASPMCCG
ncbi:carbohydrate kinase [Streptomyces hirsutus]